MGLVGLGAHAAGFSRGAPHVPTYAGLDVSLETSICVVDAEGRIKLEAKAPSDPEAIAAHLS